MRPQEGPQTSFLTTAADVAIYGGAAGGGKSWALLAEAARHVHRPGYRGLILRNSSTQITQGGGPWDESLEIYPSLGGIAREQRLTWKFPARSSIKFGFLEHEKDKENYRGGQLAFIGFDELTSFSETQFWYLLSRNRTTCGIRPYVRATTNPDADSWVARLVAWFIDQDTGFAIPERSGVIRYFCRESDGVVRFSDDPADVTLVDPDTGEIVPPKSFTFIPASLGDNQILMRLDPGYRGNLMAMPLVDRERLLRGNWKIRHTAGNVFRREWFNVVNVVRWGEVVDAVRYWDKAGSDEKSKDGDYSVGTLILKLKSGRFCVADRIRRKLTPFERNKLIEQTAEIDAARPGIRVRLWIEKEPGHNAQESTLTLQGILGRFGPRFDKVIVAKMSRWLIFSAAAESGVVDVVNAPWLQEWLDELEAVPAAVHDDQADSVSGGYIKLVADPDNTARKAPSAGGAPKRR